MLKATLLAGALALIASPALARSGGHSGGGHSGGHSSSHGSRSYGGSHSSSHSSRSYGGDRSSSHSSGVRDHYVHGYTRRNGTHVDGYHATNPDSTRNDNYSTRGNTNPYTGQEGTKPRDGEPH